MPLSADKKREVRPGPIVGVPYPVAASTTIYSGALVCVNSSGYLVPAANNTTYECVGVAAEGVVNSGSNGDKSCTVQFLHVEEFPSSGITQADVGKSCYVIDDTTVGDDAAASKNVHVGTIVRLVATNVVEVHILPRPAVTAQPT